MTAPSITDANASTNLMTGTGFVDDLVNSKMDSRWLLNSNYNDSIGSINGSTGGGSPSSISGLWGTGYSLTSSDWVNFGNNYTPNKTNYSCGIIFKIDPLLNTGFVDILSKYDFQAGVDVAGHGFEIIVRDVGTVTVTYAGGDGSQTGQAGSITSTTNVKDNNYHSLVYSINSNTLYLFIDGIQEGSLDITSFANINSPDNFRVNGRALDSTRDGEFSILEVFASDNSYFSAGDALNWHNQLRHAVDGTNTSVQVNSSTEAESL